MLLDGVAADYKSTICVKWFVQVVPKTIKV